MAVAKKSVGKKGLVKNKAANIIDFVEYNVDDN